MPNIQVTHVTDLNNARSESAIAINPNNPAQIVSGSKSFRNFQTYDFTLATQYSEDGGLTWQDSEPLPLGTFTILSDPTLAWDDVGNAYLLGLSANNPPQDSPIIGLEAYKSTDGGKTWNGPNRIHASSGDDKQWIAGDGNAGSPFHGRIYAAWDGPGGLCFARTKDGGANWVGAGAGTTPTGTALGASSFAPEINIAANGDVYIVFIGNGIQMFISRDGGDTFQLVTAASGISTLGNADAPHFPGESFRCATLATACVFGQTVVTAWADFREGPSRVYYARSADGGATWVTPSSGQPLLTRFIPSNLHHFDPQLVVDPTGVMACAFYEFGPKPTTPLIDVALAESFDSGASFDDFIVTDQPWDPTVDAPWAHGDPNITFIGDYFDIAASNSGFYPLWTDTRTGFQDLFTAIVPRKQCVFVVNRSTIGQDEVDARRKLPGGAVIPDAFRVVVDGFNAAEIGATGTNSTIPVASPAAGINIVPRGNLSDNLDYGREVQRFTFFYDIDFGATDTAFTFAGPTKLLTLSASVGAVFAQAEIELVKQPDPFILHGDPPWLSVDLRVFVARAGQSMFGVPGVNGASDAPRFIQQIIASMTSAEFDSLSTGEDQSKLYVQPYDEHGAEVFNFALAKVHYIGTIGANNVRVFFRMFQAQTASLAFDFPPGTDYRRSASNADGQPIPLCGIQEFEYVTIPFFAEPRKNAVTISMTQQTDEPNVRKITAHTDGSEVDNFFGCWLDMNQPFDARLPFIVPTNNVDGPFNDPLTPLFSIQEAILRSLHQCLIAEIAFDPVPIPLGAVPGNWDKLAQRNLAWADVGSARAATTFEIQPTPANLAAGQMPDELMIDWGGLPKGSRAFLYMSATGADEILTLARRTYSRQTLTRIDDHTLEIKVGGVGYVPILASGTNKYAALLSIEPAASVRKGEVFNVVVRQVTNVVQQVSNLLPEKAVSSARGPLNWRRVLGAFQVTIPVKTKQLLLPREERDLSVLRWIARAIPAGSRWSLVFKRYVEEIAGRVRAFGGDPNTIQPSPTGDGGGHPKHENRASYTGKIGALIFDRFGDFEGFLLDAEAGERRFLSREKAMAELAERAWRERLRMTVHVVGEEPDRPTSIVVHRPPATSKMHPSSDSC
jgi:hypothetical protein